jgi:hypothetical protein
MKLWLVKHKDAEQGGYGLMGVVVRAETEEQARRLAHETWTDTTVATCTELHAEGEPGIILCDDRA